MSKPSHIQQLANKERDKLLQSVDSFEDTLWLDLKKEGYIK